MAGADRPDMGAGLLGDYKPPLFRLDRPEGQLGMASGAGEYPQDGHRAAPRRLVRRALNIALVVISVGGLVWLVAAQHAELGSAIAGVGHAHLILVVAAIFCERVSMFAFARMQKTLLRAGGHKLSMVSAIGIAFAGNALSQTVPIAGPGLSAAFTFKEFEHHRVRHPAAAFALVVSGALSTGTLMVILAVGAVASGNRLAVILGLLAALGVAAGIVATLLALRLPSWRRRVERAAAVGVRVARRLRRKSGEPPETPPETVVARALSQLAGLRLSPRDWALVVFLAFGNWLGDAACLALSIRATGSHVPLHDLLLVWSAGLAAGSIGITPGGAGFVEVALIAALAGTGLSTAKATVAVFIYRLISLWLVLLVGWILFLSIRYARARARRATVSDPRAPKA
jgi:putative heme transporter